MKTSKFQFVNPYLVELHFTSRSDFQNGDNIEMQNVFHIQIKRDPEENLANVELELETNVEKENVPFELRIKVASDFRWEELEENAVETMLNQNAPALLLGYMRPIVANITNASGTIVYNLPFMNFRE